METSFVNPNQNVDRAEALTVQLILHEITMEELELDRCNLSVNKRLAAREIRLSGRKTLADRRRNANAMLKFHALRSVTEDYQDTMSTRFQTILSLSLTALLALSGCSSTQGWHLFGSSAEDPAALDPETSAAETPDETPPPAENVPEKKTSRMEGTSTLEVLWQVPSEAVEKYHFYYGLDPNKLDNHIVVPIAELQKSDHPKHGPVFRYELREVPANRAIYLSLRAENKFGISEPSTPTKVEAGQRTVNPK